MLVLWRDVGPLFMQPQSIDKMVELLSQTTGRQLAAFNVFLFAAPTVVPIEPGKGSVNELQRLSQVMSRHCEQYRIELARALQVPCAAGHNADLSAFNHDTPLSCKASS